MSAIDIGIIVILLGILNLIFISIIYVKLNNKMQKAYSSIEKDLTKEVESRVRFELVGVRVDLRKDILLLMDYLNVEVEETKQIESIRRLVPKKERNNGHFDFRKITRFYRRSKSN